MISNDSVSTHQLASASTDAISPDNSQLPLYPSLVSRPSAFDLSEFLSRPTCLYTYSGSGTITTLPIETYASDFIGLKSVQEKLKYLSLVRGTFKIDFLLTCSPYAFGQFICAFYMGTPASTSCVTSDVTLFNYWLSSKDKVILDCSTTTTASIQVPMHIAYPYTNVSAALPDFPLSLLKMSVGTLTPIVNALDGTDASYTIRIYVSVQNPEICVPVFDDSGSIYTSETQRAMDGPISYPASIVSKIGKVLSNVPVIGPFAYATSLAADAVSNIAVLFGFSRPKDLSIIAYPHEEDYASYAGNLRVKGVTIDPLAEIPIDNSFLGDKGDNLSYQSTICREGLASNFTWSKTDLATTFIATLSVHPSTSFGVDGVFSMTPLGYCSQLFNLWRGSISYRVVIPSNRYVRGKLRVFWAPFKLTTNPTGDQYLAITQNATSTVIDLSQSADVTIIVPFAAQQPYQPVASGWVDQAGAITTEQGNGYLYFMVEEPLMAQPDALSLTVLVWVKAGNDFQFMIPSMERMLYLRRQVYDNFGSADTFPDDHVEIVYPDPPCEQMTGAIPSDDDYFIYTSEKVGGSVDSSIVLLPESFQTDVGVLHMGEEFVSLRNMLKRFYPSFNMESGGTGQLFGFFVSYLPLEPMFYTDSHANIACQTAFQTPLRYISNLFYGVRGSVRYRISTPYGAVNNQPMQFTVSRDFAPLWSIFHAPSSGPTNYFSWLQQKANVGSGEACFRTTVGEPAFFEIPYQCVSQFQPTTIITPPFTDYGKVYGVKVDVNGNNFQGCDLYVAAGEDFMPVIWNGVPLLSAYSPGSFVG